MMRSVFPARALFPVLPLLLSTALSPPKSPTPHYGFPRLAPGLIWVSSVPVGLEVHSGDSPTPQKVLGRTPLVLKARDLDRYVTVTIQKAEFGGELPNIMAFLDFTSRATHNTIWKGENAEGKIVEEDRSRAITYDVRPDKPTIIALFETGLHSLTDLDRLYPQGANFRFSDEALRTRLTEKGVPPEFISAGIRLLHRGGKIALPGTKGWEGCLIAEVKPFGQVDLVDSPPK